MPKRPCLDCGRLTTNRSRCDTHQASWQARQDRRRGSATARGYDATWRRNVARALAKHRAQYGNWCPGWKVDAHPSPDLTGDHITPLARGGTNQPDNIQVLCRACNARKHANPQP